MMLTHGEFIRRNEMSLIELESYCKATGKSVLIHNGKLCGFLNKEEDC